MGEFEKKLNRGICLAGLTVLLWIRLFNLQVLDSIGLAIMGIVCFGMGGLLWAASKLDEIARKRGK